MNQLMGIKHDRDVLKDKDLFNPNTAIKCMMAAHEKDQLEATGVLVMCLMGPCSVYWTCVSTIKESAVPTSPSQIWSVLLRFFGRLVGTGILMVRPGKEEWQ